ncbi:MAG: hypothetical protein Ct9H90mP22_9000 [Gammaproteobacteria bacterium]|nr:MAG: hypothetical protein Ct9H90mP22_9000 [Gammaproteobacteria bacterium]
MGFFYAAMLQNLFHPMAGQGLNLDWRHYEIEKKLKKIKV